VSPSLEILLEKPCDGLLVSLADSGRCYLAFSAVGSTVIQIAKNVIGCKKVIGIAGGQKKCDWYVKLRNPFTWTSSSQILPMRYRRVKSLGADDCVDYKSDDYAQRLKELLPDYADVYFDNVGGEILDVMLPLVKRYGKVAVCGAIASELRRPAMLFWRS
jgi:NADPH-dependent curcumin reductase CurA